MRRNFIVALAGAAVLAVMPATVLAQGHHAKHHASHHAKRHHVRTHVRHFRAANSGSTGSTGTTSTPGTSGSDSAGTVTSFDGTTLVITPTSGPPVSGTVNNNTQLSCESSSQTTTMQSDMRSDGGGNQGGSGDQGGSGSQGGSDDQGDQSGSDDQGDQGDQGDADDQGAQTTCTTANLTPGTKVHEADLSVSSAGSVWEKVDLITG
jgi:hypothetical protein